MAGRDDLNLGDRIQDIVESAINSRDFETLNRSIRNTIDDVFEEWKIGPGTNMNESFNKYRIPYAGAGDRFRNVIQRSEERRSSYRNGVQLYTRNVPGVFSGTLLQIVGGLGVFAFGLSSLLSLGGGALASELGTAAMIVGCVLAPLTAVSGGLMAWGTKMKNRARRFREYVRVLGDRKYCSVDELADAVNKSEPFIVRDLRKMIAARYFLQGHLDRQNTTLIVDDETYRQYQETDRNYRTRLVEEEKNRKEESIFAPSEEKNEEFLRALEEGNAYIREIREANERIPGEEISKKLYRLEDVLKKIFLILQQKPDQLGRLRKFMNYYMPTTRKLVQTYQELDSHAVSGENINRAKAEIEQTLDTINDAYEKLLDSFYEDALMDVHTDRAVLENMLTNDGLTDSPFEKQTLQQGL